MHAYHLLLLDPRQVRLTPDTSRHFSTPLSITTHGVHVKQILKMTCSHSEDAKCYLSHLIYSHNCQNNKSEEISTTYWVQ